MDRVEAIVTIQSLKREVALKLLRNELNANLTALARFQVNSIGSAKLFWLRIGYGSPFKRALRAPFDTYKI